MRPLLYSQVCDWCDGVVDTSTLHRGWVVWRQISGKEEYVFQSRADAERWRTVQGLDGRAIRAVLSMTPFRWQKSRGSVKDVHLADRLYQIFDDHRFEPRDNRAFIDPDVDPVAA